MNFYYEEYDLSFQIGFLSKALISNASKLIHIKTTILDNYNIEFGTYYKFPFSFSFNGILFHVLLRSNIIYLFLIIWWIETTSSFIFLVILFWCVFLIIKIFIFLNCKLCLKKLFWSFIFIYMGLWWFYEFIKCHKI